MKRQISNSSFTSGTPVRVMVVCLATGILVCTAWLGRSGAAEPDPEPRLTAAAPGNAAKIAAYPPAVQLDSARDYQQLIAILTRTDGITVDVTGDVSWQIEDESVAKLDRTR